MSDLNSPYQKNIAKGLCGFCPVSVEEFNPRTGLLYKTCEKHRGSSKGKKNKTALRWKSEELCVQCGTDPGISPHTGKKYWKCNICRGRENKIQLEKRIKDRTFRKCLDCNILIGYQPSIFRCTECKDKRNKLVHKNCMDKKIATGICVRCNKNPIATKQECRPCANARSIQVMVAEKIRKEERKSEGRCIRCTVPVNDFHQVNGEMKRYTECIKCYANRHNGNISAKRLSNLNLKV